MVKYKGFTLIELMVVVLIIAILAAIAIPKMFGVSAKAKASEAMLTLATFENLHQIYFDATSSLGNNIDIGLDQSPSSFLSYNFSIPGSANAGLSSGVDVGGIICGGSPLLGWQTKFNLQNSVFQRSYTDSDCEGLTPNWKLP
jgi:prepilin-type N-terminal cleavage/methylation domain-containing protein